jgi:hypothetical protein
MRRSNFHLDMKQADVSSLAMAEVMQSQNSAFISLLPRVIFQIRNVPDLAKFETMMLKLSIVLDAWRMIFPAGQNLKEVRPIPSITTSFNSHEIYIARKFDGSQ